jgi:hypothetical protein
MFAASETAVSAAIGSRASMSMPATPSDEPRAPWARWAYRKPPSELEVAAADIDHVGVVDGDRAEEAVHDVAGASGDRGPDLRPLRGDEGGDDDRPVGAVDVAGAHHRVVDDEDLARGKDRIVARGVGRGRRVEVDGAVSDREAAAVEVAGGREVVARAAALQVELRPVREGAHHVRGEVASETGEQAPPAAAVHLGLLVRRAVVAPRAEHRAAEAHAVHVQHDGAGGDVDVGQGDAAGDASGELRGGALGPLPHRDGRGADLERRGDGGDEGAGVRIVEVEDLASAVDVPGGDLDHVPAGARAADVERRGERGPVQDLDPAVRRVRGDLGRVVE